MAIEALETAFAASAPLVLGFCEDDPMSRRPPEERQSGRSYCDIERDGRLVHGKPPNT